MDRAETKYGMDCGDALRSIHDIERNVATSAANVALVLVSVRNCNVPNMENQVSTRLVILASVVVIEGEPYVKK